MSIRLSPYVLILALIAFFACSPAAMAQDEPRTAGAERGEGAADPQDTYRQLQLFGDVFERVRGNYVEEVTDQKLIEYALNGMLSQLDPHSGYLNEDAFGDMEVQTNGEFGGLGIEVTMENGFVKVVSPIDDTPAFRAGVQAGDYITHLDGESVLGLSLNEAVDKMRGKRGSTIELTIQREGAEEEIVKEITRDVIKIQSVKHEIKDDDIGYIRVTTFNKTTTRNLEDAIKDIRKQAGDNLIGYVLDLRNNPGGLLEQAISVSDAFLDKGEIVSTRGRSEQDTKRDNATKGDLTDGKPMVVLINGGSASASEIVSGALQDHGRALVVGTPSFGKGSVQTIVPIPGHGAIKLTTARYYTPSGNSIQAKGITPDIIVPQAKLEEIGNGMYLRERDLPGALDKNRGDTGKDESEPNFPLPADTDGKNNSGTTGDKKDKDAEDGETPTDYQLLRAMDLLRGVVLYENRRMNG